MGVVASEGVVHMHSHMSRRKSQPGGGGGGGGGGARW